MDLPNELISEILCYMDVGPLIICSQATVLLNAVSLHRKVWEFKKVKGKGARYHPWGYILDKQYEEMCIKDENLKGISHVHTLDLGRFVNKHDRHFLYDVSALGRIHTLTIDRSELMDVGLLSHVHTLTIPDAEEKDLGVLGNVHTLNLRWSYLVTDVSTLGHLHTLYVSSVRLADVSALGHLHTAGILHSKVRDVTALANVHTVELYATRLTDVNALANVHSLYLGLTNVKNVSALGRLHTLDLHRSSAYDVSALEDLKKLRLRSGDYRIVRCMKLRSPSGRKLYQDL